MFQIETKQPVKLSNFNPRAEKHGKERKPAADLHIEAALQADILKHFAPDLREAIYKAAEDQADLVDPDRSAFTALRFQKMSPFSWQWEGKGYELRIDYGLGGDSDIVLDECTVRDFHISPQQGGTVMIKFRISAHPDEHQAGILAHRIQQDIDVTLIPPPPSTVGELFGETKDNYSDE